MLRNTDGTKRGEETISDEVWRALKVRTYEGIQQKLDATRRLLAAGGSIHLCAGLYTFALEEYGKLLLLKKSPRIESNNKRLIKYAKEFTDHKHKLTLAFKDLAISGHQACYILNDKAEFNPTEFSWEFNVGLLADMEARLSIFHSDLSDSQNGIIVQDSPHVDVICLAKAMNELQIVVNATTP